MINSASSRFSAITASDLNNTPLPVREIAFIDPDVDAIDILLAGLRPEVEAVLLDGVQPALRQIALVVGERRDLATIHVIAHGAPGEIRFAAGTLSTRSLSNHTDDLGRLGCSVSEGAELALWSCDVGAGEQGATFVDALQRAVGRAVGAATYRIGAAARGGRWDLEAHVPAPLTAQGMANYAGVMANISSNSWNNVQTVSEQAATTIIDNNVNLTTWAAGTGTLTLSVASPNSGDQLSILSVGNGTGQISVTGSGAGATIRYQNVVIGTIDNTNDGLNGHTLLINLSGSGATQAAVQKLMQSLQLQNTSDAPPSGARAITLTADNSGSADTVSGASVRSPRRTTRRC